MSGASLVVPFINYWWPCIPASLSREALNSQLVQDQWVFRVAHYTPWLFNWWMTQKLFPSLSIMEGNVAIFSRPDLEMLKKLSETPSVGEVNNLFSFCRWFLSNPPFFSYVFLARVIICYGCAIIPECMTTLIYHIQISNTLFSSRL